MCGVYVCLCVCVHECTCVCPPVYVCMVGACAVGITVCMCTCVMCVRLCVWAFLCVSQCMVTWEELEQAITDGWKVSQTINKGGGSWGWAVVLEGAPEPHSVLLCGYL